MADNQRLNSQRIAQWQRQARAACDLRTSGLSWETVAERTGYSSASNACRAVTNLEKKITTASVDARRSEEDRRLLAMLEAIWPYATGGERPKGRKVPQGWAVSQALNIVAARMRLHGLESPKVGEPPASIERQYVGVSVTALLAPAKIVEASE